MSALEMNSLGKVLPSVTRPISPPGRRGAAKRAGEGMEIELSLDTVPEVEQALSVKMDLVGQVGKFTLRLK